MDTTYFGLILKEDERDELLSICLTNGIAITYPQMFAKGSLMTYLWCFNPNGIGGASTQVMHHMEKNRIKIIHGTKELKEFLKSDEWDVAKLKTAINNQKILIWNTKDYELLNNVLDELSDLGLDLKKEKIMGYYSRGNELVSFDVETTAKHLVSVLHYQQYNCKKLYQDIQKLKKFKASK